MVTLKRDRHEYVGSTADLREGESEAKDKNDSQHA